MRVLLMLVFIFGCRGMSLDMEKHLGKTIETKLEIGRGSLNSLYPPQKKWSPI